MKSVKKYSDMDLSPIEVMRHEIDNLFDDMVPMWMKGWNGGTRIWAPETDMRETDSEYLITVDLPGMTKDDLEINFKDGRLTVSGERKREEKEETRDYIRKERYFGSFSRGFLLPASVKEEKIKATFKKGVLTITVPKEKVSKGKKIAIE